MELDYYLAGLAFCFFILCSSMACIAIEITAIEITIPSENFMNDFLIKPFLMVAQ